MSLLDRVTDLWVEGTTVYLGEDPQGPLCLWVNTLNSFQHDDARRDGQAAQHSLSRQLRDETHPARLEFL
jgi:hypothetical protein